MSSAAEARFRIQAPNSRPRRIKVIALDPPSDPVVKHLAEQAWKHATFLTASSVADSRPGNHLSVEGWLSDIAGQTKKLVDEVDTADLVVMVAAPGGHAHMASIIGEACSNKRVMTTALIVGGTAAADDALSHTLAQVRPWSLMVVIANADDYIEDMLSALRA